MTQLAASIDRGSEATQPAIPSNPRLVAEIRRYGWFDTTGCYQCGTCTLSCDLATGPAAFPRKTLRYAMLGLEQPLAASLEPWLCHDCGDCAESCPREADPRVSIETLRRWLVGRYDWTGLASRIMRSKAWYLGSLGVATLVTLGLIVLQHLWRAGMPVSDFLTTGMGVEHMFPTMTWFTLAVTVLPLALLVSFAVRMWWKALGSQPGRIPLRHYAAELKTLVVETVTQERMRRCEPRNRWLKHFFLALGTVVMLVVVMFFLRWFQTDAIYPLYTPQRWVGYLATAMILYGSGDVLLSRMRKTWRNHEHSELPDVMLPLLLFLTALSGILVHVFRYAGLELAAHYTYALHIVVTTPMLVVEIPFGKWSHMIYRPLALYLDAVKARAAAEAPAGEAVAQHA